MASWLLIGVVAVGSYLLRYSLFGLFARSRPGPRLELALRHVAAAALGALVGVAVLVPGEAGRRVVGSHQVAIVVALVVVKRTGNQLHALAVGLPVIWLGAALGV